MYNYRRCPTCPQRMTWKETLMSSKWILSLAVASIFLPTHMVNAAPLDDALKVLEAGGNAQAVEVLTKLANDGNPLAQLRLGDLYFHGKGVAEDENRAIHWWKKSAASGNAEAMYQIAHAYLFGNSAAKSVDDPDREAASWYFQAASAGHAEAAYTLGLLFIAGKGVVEDHNEAIRWFRVAAGKGHVEARKAMETTEKSLHRPAAKPKR
jgi:TPR repeat protein